MGSAGVARGRGGEGGKCRSLAQRRNDKQDGQKRELDGEEGDRTRPRPARGERGSERQTAEHRDDEERRQTCATQGRGGQQR